MNGPGVGRLRRIIPMATAPTVLLLWGEDAFLLREAAIEALGGVHPVEVEAAEWQGGETSDLAAA